jgi:hypothetical protein
MKKHWIWAGLIIAILFIFLFYGKVFFSSRTEFREGEEAVRKGDLEQAILHYDRAVHWYTPGSSSVEKSIERIWEIGQRLEKKGDYEKALRAYWSLRSSLYGVRSFYTPYPSWIEKANERIAGLWLSREPYSAEEKAMSPAARKEHYLTLLRKDRAPKTGWAALTEIGFFGWVVSVLVFIFTFLKSGGGIFRSPGVPLGGMRRPLLRPMGYRFGQGLSHGRSRMRRLREE